MSSSLCHPGLHGIGTSPRSRDTFFPENLSSIAYNTNEHTEKKEEKEQKKKVKNGSVCDREQ
jgi:hypothetical protein